MIFTNPMLHAQLRENEVGNKAIAEINKLDLDHYQGQIELFFDKDGFEEIPAHAAIILIWTASGYRLKTVDESAQTAFAY